MDINVTDLVGFFNFVEEEEGTAHTNIRLFPYEEDEELIYPVTFGDHTKWLFLSELID